MEREAGTRRPKGRPRYPDKLKRGRPIPIRLRPDEQTRLNALVRKTGMNPSEVIRLGLEIFWLNTWGRPILIDLPEQEYHQLKNISQQIGDPDVRMTATKIVREYIASKKTAAS